MTFLSVPEDEASLVREALISGITVTTSGSTSRPKQVRLSADALVASVRATEEVLGTGGWILALPLTYIAGIMVVARSLVAGSPLVDARREPFNAATFADGVTALSEGTWFASLVPAQLVRLVELAERNTIARDALRRLDRILIGGQAIPDGLISRATNLGIRVTATYGSAETAGGVVYDGRAIGDTVVRIGADDRIEISSSSLADGYDGDDELTGDSFITENGRRWWRTTDLGSLSDGVLTVHGRVDDIIIAGGIKVSLAEIDRVLAAEGIDAAVSWYEVDDWGQVPAIVSTTELDPVAIRTLIETTLSKAARPSRFVTVAELPRLASGKIDRLAVHALVQRSQS